MDLSEAQGHTQTRKSQVDKETMAGGVGLRGPLRSRPDARQRPDWESAVVGMLSKYKGEDR